VELFREHFREKYIIKKQKDTAMKEETDGGGGHDEEEDEWNKQIRQKRDKIEATTLEYYASQLNKGLENRMEEIHTSSKERLYTQNGGEHNQTNRGNDTFETRRISRKEEYRTLEI
jgi:DNA anti-recombination protein RmuC